MNFGFLKSEYRGGIVSAISASLFFFQASAFAAAVDCPELRDWKLAHAALLSENRSMKQVAQAQSTEYENRKAAAEALYRSYLSKTGSIKNLQTCLSEHPERGGFMNSLQNVFYERSLDRLRSASSPALKAMMKLYDERAQAGALPLFRLTGHSHESSPTELKGGFHRSTGSIFMDLDRVSPEEWLLILSHEILHGLDDQMVLAIRGYSQPKQVREFAEWAESVSDPRDLGTEQRQALYAWIEAGLGRGLWAEYRAWVATVVVYQEGVREGIWPRIEWMEKILEGRRVEVSLARHIYLYLDTRSSDPSSGIFSRPLIRQALQEVRESYRRNDRLPSMGRLGEVSR